MGRILSCKKCGAWVEVAGKVDAAQVVCDNCKGGAAARAAETAGAVGPGGQSRGRGPSIGPESGEIGSRAFGQSTLGPNETLAELQARLDALTARSTAESLQEPIMLPEIEPLAEAESTGEAASTAGPLGVTGREARQEIARRAAEARERAEEMGRRAAAQAREKAEQFGREQAEKVVDNARREVEQKGIGAVRDAGDFVRGEADRIGREARQAVEGELKSAANRAAESAREAIRPAKARPKSQQPAGAVAAHGQAQSAGVCRLCNDRITVGDKLTVCPNCGSRYHEGCYSLMGQCPVCRKAASANSPQAATGAAGQQVPLARPSPAQGMVCSGCGTHVRAGSLVCPKCGRWLYSGRKPAAGTSAPDATKLPTGCIVALVIAAAVVFFAIVSSL